MTKSTLTPIAIALFGLTLILFFQISSLLLLISLNSPLSHRGSGRDKLTALTSTNQPADKAPKTGDGRRDA